MTTIKVLMVDVDGVVLVHPHPLGWSADLERDLGLTGQSLQRAFFERHFDQALIGHVALRDCLKPILQQIAPHLTCDQLIEYWFSHDSHLNLDLLQQLGRAKRRGFKLHLATAQEHERAAFLWNTLALREHFDAIHYSADIGWTKPAPQFFAEVERRAGFLASEVFFIDDRITNVEAARKHGWNAAVWTGGSSLDDLLASTGH